MAEELLGVGFEIHGGGNDLVFPHHENEAAQTRMRAGGAELAQIWMHNGMLQMGEEKMAKSRRQHRAAARRARALGPRRARPVLLRPGTTGSRSRFDDDTLERGAARGVTADPRGRRAA